MLSRTVRLQLVLFAVITFVGMATMAFRYIGVPSMLGLGHYTVTMELPHAGGLYVKSLVTFRGNEVGEVSDIRLAPGGTVLVTLAIDDDVAIPDGSKAQVRSSSVIGEQFVNFVPERDGSPLRPGATIRAEQVELPTTTGELLTSVEALLTSIPDEELRTAVHETGEAFTGRGEDLGRLIDSSLALQQEASDHLPQTIGLLEGLQPVLRTQDDLDPTIRQYAGSLNRFTAALESADSDLRSVLGLAAPAFQATEGYVEMLDRDAVPLLQDLATIGPIVSAYFPAVQHIYTLIPALIPGVYGTLPVPDKSVPWQNASLYFKLNLNDAPHCTTGFSESDNQRSPDDLTPGEIIRGSYCKVAPDDPRVVRGARNNPCPNDPNRRGPDAASCGLVFDQAAVKRTQTLTAAGADGEDTANAAARLLAPNGDFFLLDRLSDAATLPAGDFTSLLEPIA